jgi:TolA protein
MEDERPPPPPPPHGQNPRPPGGGLPDGNYDIFIVPPHSAGGGFIYLPSLQPHRNSFIAGIFVAMAAMGIYVVVMPVFQAWLTATMGGNGAGVLMLVAIVGLAAWAMGKTTAENSAGSGAGGASGANKAGAEGRQQYRSNGPESQHYTPPPPPPGQEAPPPPPRSEPDPPPKPKPSSAQSGWEKAREETRRREEERKRSEELKRKREAAQKMREEAEAAAKKVRDEAEAAAKKAQEEAAAAAREAEAAARKAKEESDRAAKAKAEKEKWEQARAREKEQRERDARERIAKEKEAREKEAKEKEAKEKEAKAAAEKAKAAAEKIAAERQKAARERIEQLRAERTRAASASGKTSPTKPYIPPTSRSAVGTEDAHSYRPYDTHSSPAGRAKSAFHSSASSISGLSESSYAPSISTARTTPPPSHRGPYSTIDPNKIQIRAVYLFSDNFPNKPVAELIANQGSVTDGLILNIKTEGLFIDDDVREVPQREWDVKAWTVALMEHGASKAKGLHVFRATLRDTENKKYTFVLEPKEAHKVSSGMLRMKDGSLTRKVNIKEIKEGDMNKLLSSLGY